MKIDRTDWKILRALLEIRKEGEDTSSSNLMKMVFDPEDRNDYQDKDTVVRKKLEKLVNLGFVKKFKGESNGRTITKYSLKGGDKIIMGDVEMLIKPDFQEEEEMKMEVNDMIFLSQGEGKFLIFGQKT